MRRLAALVGVAVAFACSGSDEARNGEVAAWFEDGLHLVDPDDGTTRALSGAEDGHEPAWSPDGTWIAFTRGREVNTRPGQMTVSDLYVIGLDGGDARLVARNASAPSWSPDGSEIVAMRGCVGRACPDGENPYELVVVDVETGEVRYLTTDQQFDGDPSWSPDGDWIVFATESGLSLVRPDGSDERSLTQEDDAHYNPSWSPDGKSIVFDNLGDVYVIAVAEGSPRRLTENEGLDFLPAWSPDGALIAYQSNEVCARAGGCTAHEPVHLRIMNADGSDPRAITGDGWVGPSWGPRRDSD